MDSSLVLGIIALLIEKGVPAYIKFHDGVELDNPTLEDLEALKVKKMSEKYPDGPQEDGE